MMISSGLATGDELADFRRFFTPMLNTPALARTIKLGIKEIAARVKLIERDKAAVIALLRDTA